MGPLTDGDSTIAASNRPVTRRRDTMAKLRHIAIECSDPEGTAKFWSAAFELEEIGRVGDLDRVGAIYLTDGLMNVSLVKAEPGTLNADPKGLNHLGFIVDDVESATALAARQGAVPLLSEEEQGAARIGGASWEMKMRTPDGVKFDLSTRGWPGSHR
jgi:catechol 2,3-dioxygenase-like lactoylglutathione lyase family enzyme